MKKLLLLLSFLTLLFGFAPTISAQEVAGQALEQRIEAVVTDVSENKTITADGPKRTYQIVKVLVTSGDLKGKTLQIENGKIPVINTLTVDKGDKVVVSVTKDEKGKNTYFITDYIRRDVIYLLAGSFAGVILLIGGLRGLTSLLSMLVSFLAILFFILPQILQGRDPILVAIVSALFIIPISFYLSHGYSKKTTTAIIGTMIALILTGILSSFFVQEARLTGFASEEAGFLESVRKGEVQMQGLLLAGIIIGALGVLDDIAISQASIVFQMKQISPKLKIRELFAKGMDVGRDHIASMVNTLVLVYTGAALPLLLLFINNPLPFSQILNTELIAEEIIRTLVVSMGLILAVPIVTFLAAITSSINVKDAGEDIISSLK